MRQPLTQAIRSLEVVCTKKKLVGSSQQSPAKTTQFRNRVLHRTQIHTRSPGRICLVWQQALAAHTRSCDDTGQASLARRKRGFLLVQWRILMLAVGYFKATHFSTGRGSRRSSRLSAASSPSPKPEPAVALVIAPPRSKPGRSFAPGPGARPAAFALVRPR